MVIYLDKPVNGSVAAYEDGFTALELTRKYYREAGLDARANMNFSPIFGLLAIPCLAGLFIWPQLTRLVYLGGTLAVIGFAAVR